MVLLVCLLMEKEPLSYSFNRWPLHITVLPWFEVCNTRLPQIVRLLEEAAKACGPLKLRTDRIEYFGNHRTRVVKLKANKKLHRLHYTLLEGIAREAKFLASDHLGPDYTPHITLGKEGQLNRRLFYFGELYVVHRTNDHQRQVVEIIKL